MLRLRSFLGDVSLLDHLRQTYLQPCCAARPARTRAGSPGIMHYDASPDFYLTFLRPPAPLLFTWLFRLRPREPGGCDQPQAADGARRPARSGAPAHGGGGLAAQGQREMECHSGGLAPGATPRPPLTEAVVQGQGPPVLPDEVAPRGPRPPTPQPWPGQVPAQPCCPGAGDISPRGLGHGRIQGFVGTGGAKEGWAAAGASGQRLASRASPGRRQSQAQATGGAATLPSTTLPRCAPGVQARCRKHPLALGSDHAKVSLLQRRLLALFPKQHTQLECRMDHNKNLQ